MNLIMEHCNRQWKMGSYTCYVCIAGGRCYASGLNSGMVSGGQPSGVTQVFRYKKLQQTASFPGVPDQAIKSEFINAGSIALVFHEFSGKTFRTGLVVFAHEPVAVLVEIRVYPVIESCEYGGSFLERIFHESDAVFAPLRPYRIVIKVNAVKI
jgi:hypothetical protein